MTLNPDEVPLVEHERYGNKAGGGEREEPKGGAPIAGAF